MIDASRLIGFLAALACLSVAWVCVKKDDYGAAGIWLIAAILIR